MQDLIKYIEECGEVATPANTMGMGDVMLPDGENFGVDGIPQKRKSKKKKKVSESIFDEDDNMNDIDKNSLLYGFLDCLLKTLNKYGKGSPKYTVEQVFNYVKQHNIVTVDKSEVTINYKNYCDAPDPTGRYEVYGLRGTVDLLCRGWINLSTDYLPKQLKKIIFKDYDVVIILYGINLSNTDIECDKSISIRCQNEGDITLGNIICDSLNISDWSNNERDGVKSISFKQNSNINKLDIANCLGIENIFANNLDIKYLNMNIRSIQNYLTKRKITKQIPNISVRTS
jgi:hypothetical protein